MSFTSKAMYELSGEMAIPANAIFSPLMWVMVFRRLPVLDSQIIMSMLRDAEYSVALSGLSVTALRLLEVKYKLM